MKTTIEGCRDELLRLPAAYSNEFHEAVYRAARAGSGAAVVSQSDLRSAGAAALAALHTRALTVYFAQADAGELESAFRLLSEAGLAEPVRFVHGRVGDLLQRFPVNPSVVVTDAASELIVMWRGLPSNASIVMPAAFAAERRWTEAGFIERIAGSRGYAEYRTSAKFVSAPTAPEEIALAEMRADPSKIVPAIRDWPYAGGAETPLPETLPDGNRWPLISIVTPSFNQGAHIEETILSIAQQRYPRVEHIVMDGASTDGTPDVLRRNRQYLTALEIDPDRGQSHAINKGIAMAHGEILTWLNSGDLLAPDALAGVALGFHTSKADLVAGLVHIRSGSRTVNIHMTSCPPGPLPLRDLLDLDGGWRAGRFFYQPEVMFTREIWQKAGGYLREDLYYNMDFELWLRMAEAAARLHVIGRPVAWFRTHEAQKTRTTGKVSEELEAYVEDYKKRNPGYMAAARPDAGRRERLKIALLNDHGFHWGAGLAHLRLARCLTNAGHEVAQHSLVAEPPCSPGQPTELTTAEVLRALQQSSPDLVITGNLHSAGIDPWHLSVVAERYPTLSALHDFWLLTGRCAYPGPCAKYLTGCDETCPTAEEYPRLAPDRIAGAWQRKQELLFGQNNLVLLANSDWTAQFARSTLEARGDGKPGPPVCRFRLSFPLRTFRPRDRRRCRERLGLPVDRFIVLLSGDLYDPRKNTQLALDALARLAVPDLTVVSLGNARPEESFPLPDVRRPGRIVDEEELALYYAAADVFLGPSTDETFGQVFIEAAACGTPAIGVRHSGMQDAIAEGITGLLVDSFGEQALADAVQRLYDGPELRRNLGIWGRLFVENEWSPEAAYYLMFQAWDRLGLVDRLRLKRNIGFRSDGRGRIKVSQVQRSEGVTMNGHTLGPEEGPYPEYSLGRFRWAYGPVSKVEFHATAEGRYSLILRYRNLQPQQRLSLRLNGVKAGSFILPETGFMHSRLLCAALDLKQGVNELELHFSKWDLAVANRPLAVVIASIDLIPDQSAIHTF